MTRASRARNALVEAVLAGALVGAFEATRVAVSADAVRALPVIATVASLGAIALAIVMHIVIGALARVPAVAAWGRDVAGDGDPRVIAVWRAALVLVSIAVFGIASFRIAAWAHVAFRFNDAGPVGLLLVATIVPIAVLVLVLATVADRRVVPRLRGRTVLAGSRVWGAAAIAAVILAVGPAFVVHRAVPALALAEVVTISLLVTAVLTTRVARIGRRRVAQLAAIVVVIAAVVGTWALGGAPRARGAIVVYGVTSRAVTTVLWSLADRDGDGYAGASVGGADCDDNNPARHPNARELAGNGIDENCTGGDAVVSSDVRAKPRPATATATKQSIVLISIDALRADHLGAWGYARKTSPALDALAATATRFAWAFTSCPSTRCAIPALLTGRYASTLGHPFEVERATIPNLAQVLRDAGWQTAAVSCCERFALARGELSGFSLVDASADSTRMRREGQSNADLVADGALEWLRDRDPAKPYFLWLHFYDPHHPYAAPDGPSFGDSDLDRYDAEIAYADRHIGRVLAALDPSTIVAVTADHGDEFNEHGIRFHARSLYNQVVRVPLIVRAPGAAPRVVDTPVSIVDVMPTLLDLAGVAGPAGMNGVSLAPALRGQPAPARPVFIELVADPLIKRDMAAVVSPPWKVIWDREANAWSLFNLADPDDTDDRADDSALPTLQKLLLETIDRETARLP